MKKKLSKIHIQTFWFSETFTTILGKIFAKFSLNYVIFDKILHIWIGYLATNMANSCEFRVWTWLHAFRDLVMPSEISMTK